VSETSLPSGVPSPPAGGASAGGVWKKLRRDPWAIAGALIVVVLALTGAAAPLIAGLEGQDPYTYHNDLLNPANGTGAGALGGVSWAHWFGVEPLTGRDLFSIVVYGARTSFLIGLTATVIAVAVGVLVGASAGYLGGWWDKAVTWTTDVLLGFPSLVFMIAAGAVAPRSIPRPVLLVAIIALFHWPRIARVIRSQTLTLKQRHFVSAARVLGAGPWHVFRRELLPNLLAPIIVLATVSIPETIGLEAALSFLGAGIPPPTPSWGRSISDAISWISTDPMYLLFPGLALFFATLAFNLLGDALGDALNPRTGKGK
jgi:peptide/nickel transport system permease protein